MAVVQVKEAIKKRLRIKMPVIKIFIINDFFVFFLKFILTAL